jgi:nucleolar GTP-binding protein
MTMSNLSEAGVSEVKAAACDKLLAARVDSRIAGNKVEGIMNRLQVFYPKPRDNNKRQIFIPDGVKESRENGTYGQKIQRSTIGYAPTKKDLEPSANDGDITMSNEATKKTARDLMWENGGPGVWAPDYREQYDLKDPEWRFDEIPQIMDGKNIADYVDPDIEAKLAALEEEEDQRMKEAEVAAMGEDPESDLDEEEEAAVYAIRERKMMAKTDHMVKRSHNHPIVPRQTRGRATDMHQPADRDAAEIQKKLEGYGVDPSKMLERGRKRERSLDARRRNRRSDTETVSDVNDPAIDGGDDMMVDVSKGELKRRKRNEKQKKRDISLIRGHSRPREPSEMGLKDQEEVRISLKAEKLGRNNWAGMAGEGDQRKSVHLVKWMNTGKKRNGTHNKR